MKKHAIIPIFIPHEGCPNDCVFCNQKKITARQKPIHAEDVKHIIDQYLPTLTGRGLETVEIAFFGGSFTGIPIEEQQAYLAVAKQYKDEGRIDKIHLSTRPDYINEEILDNLKAYHTDIIELGVQSFDDSVLQASNRGHNSEIVYKSCELIQAYSFELGIQLMIGLPGDTHEKSVYSAMEAVKIGPSIARLYPTIIIEDTELLRMYERGVYQPLSQKEAVFTTKEMYKILDAAGIQIIRVGLKSTDIINEHGAITGGTYHPAFRQLVESEIAKEILEEKLTSLLCSGAYRAPGSEFPEDPEQKPCFTFQSNSRCFSNMIGNKRSNKEYFAAKYPHIEIRYTENTLLADNHYNVIK
ncbi:elongator complex protein 3 [Aminipila luticellarii]|uniref:Radical SAM protein n=1 Tax=Aminipila luticellarii TaxID=2507160 RepID=A0A410PUF6_9FIRM|nr:radical SAM protein [Aminipila luticellarii]QAT42553.1 radical SAM protein [Aminipila luticellarii]